MCNPRRIEVRATSTLSRTWQETLTRTASATVDVTGEARLRQPFGTLLGSPLRHAFEQALGADPRWTWSDGAYRLALEDGEVAYHPGTGEIEMTARRSGLAEARGSASRTVSGRITANTDATASGTYYGDGWAGQTEAYVRSQLHSKLQKESDRKAEQEADQQEIRARDRGRSQLADQQGEIDELAADDARRNLGAVAERARAGLDRQASEQLAETRDTYLRPVNLVLRTAYRDTIEAYARAHGAQNLSVDEDGDGLVIEFEIEG
ncbi:hypothetical protein ACFVHB_00320 [Kitasatospora sp. NPDC127111]|uniref:hypothetical protein n=1 Tax=Kitasatospora sp. NPDC127111 TaxID=3345363 RepID=UPI003640A4B8